MLSVCDLVQRQLPVVVVVHIIGNAVQASGKDLVAFISGLVLEPAVLHDEVLEVRHETCDEVVGALDDFILVAVAFLDDLHHDAGKDGLEHVKTLVVIVLHVRYEEVVAEIVIVSGKIGQVHMQHHDHIVLAGILEAVHLAVVQNKDITFLQHIGVVTVPQLDASVENVDDFHVIMEVDRVLIYVGCDHVDRQLIFVNDFFF